MENRKGRILVAEDERPIARAIELKLMHEGYEVVCAANGLEALEKIKEENFDLILLDLVMPEMNGFELLQKMKDKNIGIPAIILSNLGQEADMDKVRQLGVADYFIKSNTPIIKIVEKINSIL